jgi:hypothetical protein
MYALLLFLEADREMQLVLQDVALMKIPRVLVRATLHEPILRNRTALNIEVRHELIYWSDSMFQMQNHHFRQVRPDNPRVIASRATPTPLIPPPRTNTSKFSLPKRERSSARCSGFKLESNITSQSDR